MPEDLAPAGVDADQAQQGADHRRLARAVGPEQADRPLGHRDGQAAGAP